jgi:hypothetical protein
VSRRQRNARSPHKSKSVRLGQAHQLPVEKKQITCGIAEESVEEMKTSIVVVAVVIVVAVKWEGDHERRRSKVKKSGTRERG